MHPQADKLNFSGQHVNPKTRSIDVRAELHNADGSLGPGQFLRVLLGGATRPNTISVPQRAVIDSPFGKIVFEVTPDNKLAPQPVELDGWTAGHWVIAKGLQNGDRVLVEGFIKANQQVMTVNVVPYVAGGRYSTSGSCSRGQTRLSSFQIRIGCMFSKFFIDLDFFDCVVAFPCVSGLGYDADFFDFALP